MKKVSIIVPVYNTANFLIGCLDSISAQTYKNIEVILVDDGSTDGSGKICDDYSNKDTRFVVIHKSNAGVSEARNTGLDNVTGDYIMFIDSDDIIDSRMVSDLLTIAEIEDISIVQSGGFISRCKNETKVINKRYTRDELLKENFLFSDVFKPSLCLGIYERKLFNEVRFPANIHFYEDFTVQSIVASKSNGAIITNKRYYNYIQREGSANHSGLTNKKKSALLIPEYLKDKGIYRKEEDYYNTLSFFIVGHLIATIMSANVGCLDFSFLRNTIKQNFKKILKAKAPKTSLRLTCLLYLIFPSIISLFVRYRLRNAYN